MHSFVDKTFKDSLTDENTNNIEIDGVEGDSTTEEHERMDVLQSIITQHTQKNNPKT